MLKMMTLRNDWRGRVTALPAAVCAVIGLSPAGALATGGGSDICGQTTRQLLAACRLEAGDDFRVGSAICLNISDGRASQACMRATRKARAEAREECGKSRDARDEVCEGVGQGPYNPVIDPANFVPVITNPYAPLQAGRFWVYENQTPEGLERIRIDVLPETRVIQGVTVTTARDVVTLDGVVIEDTIDWLAEDVSGDVWYFGEIVKNFEDGLLANLDGSFEAGKNGAKAGFWVRAAPQVGEVFRQEFDLGNAEDVVEVSDLNATDTTVPFSADATGPIVKTKDTTPRSPDAVEFKYYVPGVGFALEVNPETGERLELVDYGPR